MSDGSTHVTSLFMVKAAPAELDAGTDMVLKVKAACASACDLRGQLVRIFAQGAAIKEMGVELTEFDGEATETEEFIVKAPTKPGSYTWTVLFPAFENEGVSHAQSSTTFDFSVRAHQIFMSVWDIPSPVTIGETFTVKIGAKCSAGCSLADLPFVIADNNENQIVNGMLWKEELVHTRGLYWAEQELVPPSEEGLCEWNAKPITTDLKIPHEATPKTFPFFAARPPDHVATVEVVDASRKTPLKNASVVLDRRSAYSDEHGIAKVEATKGQHELHVYKEHYQIYQTTVEVDGDVNVKAELIYDPDIYAVGNEVSE